MASQRTEQLAMRTGLVTAGRPPVILQNLWWQAALVAVYLALYLLLDWASMIYPFLGYNITPWNPPPGLSLACKTNAPAPSPNRMHVFRSFQLIKRDRVSEPTTSALLKIVRAHV